MIKSIIEIRVYVISILAVRAGMVLVILTGSVILASVSCVAMVGCSPSFLAAGLLPPAAAVVVG